MHCKTHNCQYTYSCLDRDLLLLVLETVWDLAEYSETASVTPRQHAHGAAAIMSASYVYAAVALGQPKKCLLMPDAILRQPCEWAVYS